MLGLVDGEHDVGALLPAPGSRRDLVGAEQFGVGNVRHAARLVHAGHAVFGQFLADQFQCADAVLHRPWREPVDEQVYGGFGQEAVGPSVRALDVPALGIGRVRRDPRRREAEGIGGQGVDGRQEHRVVRGNGVQLIPVDFAVFPEQGWLVFRAEDPFPLGQGARRRADVVENLIHGPDGLGAAVHLQLVHAVEQGVHVRVDEPRQHEAAFEVYGFNARSGERGDFVGTAHSGDAAVLHGERFGYGSRVIQRDDPAVGEDAVNGQVGFHRFSFAVRRAPVRTLPRP